MNIALWGVQALLALVFAFAGFMKAARPIVSLAPQMPWTQALPVGLVRFIGVAELLGAIGLILPLLLGVQPWLTPLAATGLALVMLLAAGFHATRREYSGIAAPVVLGILAAFIAYGRTALVTA